MKYAMAAMLILLAGCSEKVKAPGWAKSGATWVYAPKADGVLCGTVIDENPVFLGHSEEPLERIPAGQGPLLGISGSWWQGKEYKHAEEFISLDTAKAAVERWCK